MFHLNDFRASIHIEQRNNRWQLDTFVLSNTSWQLERLASEDLHHLSYSTKPHIMISGNNIDGTATDKYGRVSSAYIHRDDRCCDNEQHCSDMLASDPDRVVQAIFTEHRHYAFDLSGEEGGLGTDTVVQGLMDKTVPGLSASLARSKQEAANLGMALSYKLYMWQYVALESPYAFL